MKACAESRRYKGAKPPTCGPCPTCQTTRLRYLQRQRRAAIAFLGERIELEHTTLGDIAGAIDLEPCE